MVVWKYEFPKVRKNRILIPESNKLLHVSLVGSTPTAWFEVDTSSETVAMTVNFFATGEDLWENHEYMGTVMLEGLVFHMYRESATTPP